LTINDLYVVRLKFQGKHPVIHLVGISIYRSIDWIISRKQLLEDKNIMNGKDELACNRQKSSSFGLSIHEHRK